MTHPDILKMERDGYLDRPEVAHVCAECENEIYEGEMCTYIGGKYYCEHCIYDGTHEATKEY